LQVRKGGQRTVSYRGIKSSAARGSRFFIDPENEAKKLIHLAIQKKGEVKKLGRKTSLLVDPDSGGMKRNAGGSTRKKARKKRQEIM